MVPAGNKAKQLWSINHTTKTIHHHQQQQQQQQHIILQTKVSQPLTKLSSLSVLVSNEMKVFSYWNSIALVTQNLSAIDLISRPLHSQNSKQVNQAISFDFAKMS